MAASLSIDRQADLSAFARFKEEFREIPGWFNPHSVAIWDSLLSFQRQVDITGHFLEIGVWYGKSAALSTLHAAPEETCILVDPYIKDEMRSTIHRIKSSNVIYAAKPSIDLVRSGMLTTDTRRFRWIHIDGEHTGPALAEDLDITNALLSDQGILAIDDFMSPSYPQITAAVFEWLANHPRDFRLFLCGFNKGYCCRVRSADRYLEFVRDSLHAAMAARGLPDVTIWKTTWTSDMNCFGMTERFEDFDYRGPDWAPGTIQI